MTRIYGTALCQFNSNSNTFNLSYHERLPATFFQTTIDSPRYVLYSSWMGKKRIENGCTQLLVQSICSIGVFNWYKRPSIMGLLFSSSFLFLSLLYFSLFIVFVTEHDKKKKMGGKSNLYLCMKSEMHLYKRTIGFIYFVSMSVLQIHCDFGLSTIFK